jgi:hypothetical protein
MFSSIINKALSGPNWLEEGVKNLMLSDHVNMGVKVKL